MINVNEEALSRCTVCGSDRSAIWCDVTWELPDTKKVFSYHQCSDCEAIYCWPRPLLRDLVKYYSRHFNYGWYYQHRHLKAVQGWHRWRRVRHLFRPNGAARGQLLDVGCGHGQFLRWAAEAGWEATGVDFPSEATRFGRERLGLTILEGDLNSAMRSGMLKSGYFDALTMWHTLEHFTDPLAEIKNAASLLKPSGQMLIVVPNADCKGMKERRENWIWCQQPYIHTSHFGGRALRTLADKAGLKVERIWSRDTWDANRVMDLRFVSFAERMDQRFRRRGFTKLAFLFHECMRLIFYGIFDFRHWALGQESLNLEGSELLLLVQINHL